MDKLEQIGNIVETDPELQEIAIQLMDSSESFANILIWLEENIATFKVGFDKNSVEDYVTFINDIIKGLVYLKTGKLDGWDDEEVKVFLLDFENFPKLELMKKIWFLSLIQSSYRYQTQGEKNENN